MTETKIISILEKLNYTNNDAKVYISTLKLGKTTVLKISKDTGIKRPTIYKIIDKLKTKGLMSEVEMGFKTYFVAQNPLILKKELEIKTKDLDEIFPSLLSLYNKDSKNNIETYDGIESIKALYLLILEEIQFSENYYVIGNQDLFLDLDEAFFREFIENRNQKNINVKMFFTSSNIALKSIKEQCTAYNSVKIKLLPKNTYFTSNIIITPHRVVFHQFKNSNSIISLKNDEVIESLGNVFELLWDNL